MSVRIVIVGGGYVGLYTALQLERRLRRGQASVTVVDPQSHMTYQPFLPEAAAGNLEPRHVVVPLRSTLPRTRVVNARVTRIRHADHRIDVMPTEGAAYEIGYDHLVVAPGSISRTLPIPGLAEHGIGFHNVAEAIYLRNQVITRLGVAAATHDAALRRRALTFVFVGGGYAGIEALGELEDMARDAIDRYEGLSPRDMRWVLVEASDHILPEVGQDMGRYTVDVLRSRNIEVKLNTRLESAVDKHITLSDGEEFDTDTLVWTAGVKPHPLVLASDLPSDEKGRLPTTAWLRVHGLDDVWSAGDCASVPDLTKYPVVPCAPNAQHAVRQARRLGENLAAVITGGTPMPYVHRYAGSVASLGLHQGVAQVYGVKVKGLPAWLMHRFYHLSRVPTLNRKLRVLADWVISAFFHREMVSLGEFADPRAEFEAASQPPTQQ